jgi:hypothetical protein
MVAYFTPTWGIDGNATVGIRYWANFVLTSTDFVHLSKDCFFPLYVIRLEIAYQFKYWCRAYTTI